MDEFESMWMEMVVFRIDLMNSLVDRHCFDKCEVDGVIILERDASEDD